MTTWASDDPAQLHAKPDLEFVGFAQGILRSWDSSTFENTVDVRGGRLTNLPVAAGVEALTYQAGNVVLLSRWKPRSGRGLATYWIGMGGRVIFPGTGAAESTIAFMRGTLVKQIIDDLVAELLVSPAGQDLAAFVIGQRAHAAVVATDQATTSTSFTDLATVGPVVPDVPVSAAGKAIVWVGSHSFATSQTPTSSQFGVMSFEVTGATARAPSNDRAFTLGYVDVHELSAVDATATTAVLLTGLSEGLHTFTAKYRSLNGDSYHFENRTLVVIGL